MPTTRVIAVDPDRPDPAAIAEAAAILRRGGLVAFATETVYGLGADATDPAAVARIFEAKGRPATNPLIVHVADETAARASVAAWPPRAATLARRFWPGPLTLVLPRSPLIPDVVTAGQDTVGVRVPRPEVARALIRAAGRPIAAPSANRSTGISPTEARHVLKDLDGRVDLILDAGPTAVGLESTVLDLSGDLPRVLRPGTVTSEQLAEALGETVAGRLDPGEIAEVARSPGLMAVHYAPRTPTYRWESPESLMTPPGGPHAVLIIGPPRPAGLADPVTTARLESPEGAARDLYRVLHDWDALGLDAILILPPPDEPRWRAVRDRVWRASRPWPG